FAAISQHLHGTVRPRPGGSPMRIPLFQMERMQSTYENYVEYNLSESGVHPLRLEELLDGSRSSAATDRLLATELGYCQSNGTEKLRELIALFYPRATREH